MSQIHDLSIVAALLREQAAACWETDEVSPYLPHFRVAWHKLLLRDAECCESEILALAANVIGSRKEYVTPLGDDECECKCHGVRNAKQTTKDKS